ASSASRDFSTQGRRSPLRVIMMSSFISILHMIQVMKFDLMPDLVLQKNYRWTTRLCLMVPPASPQIMPLGTHGVVRMRDKMLLYLQFYRAHPNAAAGSNNTMNHTSVVQRESIASGPIFCRSGQLNPQRCTILPIIHDLLMNFTLPNEGGG
ncbi:Uncharacterized protein FKW44_002449, partial [Caligus rogercresseyi]